MKEPKTKPDADFSAKRKAKPTVAPKQITDKAAAKVKEGTKKAAVKAKESIKQAAKPSSDADESPQRYAENRIEESTEYAADRLNSPVKKPRIKSKQDQPPQETAPSSEQNSTEERLLSIKKDSCRQKPAQLEERANTQSGIKSQEIEAPDERNTPADRLSAQDTYERPEPRERDYQYNRKQSEALAQSPQAENYQRKVSAEKIIREKKDAHQESSQPLDKSSKIDFREQAPIRANTEMLPKGEETVETVAPKVKEYQVQKWHEKSEVERIQKRTDSPTVREPVPDVKEVIRKEPNEPVRDVPTPAESKEPSLDSAPIHGQQRQLAIDKYRQTVRERREQEHAKQYQADQPAENGVPDAEQPHYSDLKPTRAVEPRNTGSESMHSHADIRSPKSLQSVRQVKEAERGISKTEKSAKVTVKTADKSIKTAEKSIKTTEQTVKTGVQATEKTAEATAKTAQATAKAAQASAKAAQTAAKTAQATAKASAKAAKTAVQVVSNVVKWIIAAVKELIAAIIAGGWVSVIIIAIIAIVSVILCLCFGVFSSNEASSENGRPMTAAIQEINGDFVDSINAKINRYKRQYKPDKVELVYEGDTGSDGSVMNWADVLGIYAVSTTTDPDNPTDVLIVTDDKVNLLRAIFNHMNSVSYKIDVETEEIPAVDDHGNPIYDDDDEPVMEEEKTLIITIIVSSMSYREAASYYGFNDDQNEMLREMMRAEYYPLFAELTGDVIGDGGQYGFGLDINPDLPPGELGYQIVQAAKRYIGRSYASMDCSKLARTAYADVGLTSMNGLSSVRMAQKCQEMGCLFTDPSQLQAGDLIFFARFDPSRGKDYCGDVNRCGTGKCRRWLHIHHVAIYINDEYLIDSTGGDNSVQIRKHWGMNTSKWKWVCFGRPTT